MSHEDMLLRHSNANSCNAVLLVANMSILDDKLQTHAVRVILSLSESILGRVIDVATPCRPSTVSQKCGKRWQSVVVVEIMYRSPFA
jgi:hypothetical protein